MGNRDRNIDTWDPAQYERFRAERSAPFYDLLALLDPVPGGRAVDFGCGTGALTADLHRALGLAVTVGVDSSPAMLEQAPGDVDGLAFRLGDLRAVDGLGPVDVVVANAALQWVPDHPAVLAAWTRLLRPGGQLAVQVPANVDHSSHVVAAEVAREQPFLDALDGDPPPDPVLRVLKPEAYAELLHQLGYAEQHVRLQVYGHVLDSTAAVVEWVKGTSLTRFRDRLPAELADAFVDRYRQRLLAVLGDHRPYFYAFKRILFRARLP